MNHRLTPDRHAFAVIAAVAAFLALFSCLPALTLAQPVAPLGATRQWTDNSGGFKVSARLIRVLPDRVVIRLDDGKDVEVPLARLSDGDLAYARAGTVVPYTAGTGFDSLESLARAYFTALKDNNGAAILNMVIPMQEYVDHAIYEDLDKGEGQAKWEEHMLGPNDGSATGLSDACEKVHYLSGAYQAFLMHGGVDLSSAEYVEVTHDRTFLANAADLLFINDPRIVFRLPTDPENLYWVTMFDCFKSKQRYFLRSLGGTPVYGLAVAEADRPTAQTRALEQGIFQSFDNLKVSGILGDHSGTVNCYFEFKDGRMSIKYRDANLERQTMEVDRIPDAFMIRNINLLGEDDATSTGVKAALDAIKGIPHISSIYLNEIPSADTRALALQISTASYKLRRFVIFDSPGFSDASAMLVIAGHHKTLQEFSISDCPQITSRILSSTDPVAPTLQSCPRLFKLELSYLPMMSGELLLALIENGPPLLILKVNDTGIPATALRQAFIRSQVHSFECRNDELDVADVMTWQPPAAYPWLSRRHLSLGGDKFKSLSEDERESLEKAYDKKFPHARIYIQGY